MRLATTLSWISLVPPSIELPLLRSQVRATLPSLRALAFPLQAVGARGRDHQLPAPLVEFRAVILERRGHGRIAFAAARAVAAGLHQQAKRRLVDFEARDLRAQRRFRQAAARVAADRVGGEFAQRL